MTLSLSSRDLDAMTDLEIEWLARMLHSHLRRRFAYDRVAGMLEDWTLENDARKPGALDARMAAHPDYAHMIVATDAAPAETPKGTISLALHRARRQGGPDTDPQDRGGAA